MAKSWGSRLAKSIYDANTVLAADSDDSPVALTLAEQRLLGRITAGNIVGLTAAQVRTLINVEDGATAGTVTVELLDAQNGSSTSLTYTVPANTLSVDDESLFFYGTWSYNSGSPTLNMTFGGTSFGAGSALSAAGGFFWGCVHRTGASAQACGSAVLSGAILGGGDMEDLTKSLSSNQDLKIIMSTGSELRSLVVLKAAP